MILRPTLERRSFRRVRCSNGSDRFVRAGRRALTRGAARARGVDVTGDQYPYLAGSTMLSTLLPPWAHAGGVPELLRRLHSAGDVWRRWAA